MNVNAELFHREHEPEFYVRKCRYCNQPERKCVCEDNERSERERDCGDAAEWDSPGVRR